MSPVTLETPIGQIAARHPLATRVFARHQIDFCCGGGLPLGEAISRKGLDADTILDEVNREILAPVSPETDWSDAPIEDLIAHILTDFHAPLREELPRLDAMAQKVARVHGERAPDVRPALASTFTGLRQELEQHMDKEETILFPMIQQGRGAMAGAPMSVMVHEHESAGQALARLRELTDDYVVPEGACNTWQALWHGLAALEESTHQHIHLENNILFPRAAQG